MVLHPSLVLTVLALLFPVFISCWRRASSWWSAKKVAPQLSAAQDCNEDVLRLIFALCTDSTLAAAARVCRTWTAPAQRELFSVLPTERERRTADPRWSEIARSMEGSAVLRSYLRELRISFLSCPALRNLRSLISTPVILGGTAASKYHFLDATQNVIRACANGLQRLDLDVRRMKKYSDLSGILCNLPKLTHLYLAWSEEPDTAVPFLDTVVELLPNLRYLRAGSCLYTAAFFANLPPASKLYISSFPVDAAIAGFSAHTMLKEVTLGPHPGCSAPHRPCPSLHEACKSYGIVLHTPPRSFSSERGFFQP
ncbi:hypothetical protein CPB85DRAFT_1337275 [Mucidula mucida]|nr:hypothetical protein CPB85DRAFT_1337275 [Mucidula mucida]